MSASKSPQARLLSIVVPVFNEEAVLPAFYSRLRQVLAELSLAFEIVFVDDGSTDATRAILESLRKRDDVISVLRLSRNFGKEIAVTAGLEKAHGDAVIIIDADLQDPPEVILSLVERWSEGFDNVYAERWHRRGEGPLKRRTAGLFYRVLAAVTNIEIPAGAGDFRLLDRRAVDAILQLREHHRFMKGLYAWVGYRSIAVPYERDSRAAGSSKWSYRKLWNLALDGITSFTVAPLKIATYLGLAVATLALAYGAVVIVKTLLFGEPVQGYPSLMVAVLFLGGTQLLFLGIIGEYLGRVFNEVKGRPLYFLDEIHLSRHAREQGAEKRRTGGGAGSAD